MVSVQELVPSSGCLNPGLVAGPAQHAGMDGSLSPCGAHSCRAWKACCRAAGTVTRTAPGSMLCGGLAMALPPRGRGPARLPLSGSISPEPQPPEASSSEAYSTEICRWGSSVSLQHVCGPQHPASLSERPALPLEYAGAGVLLIGWAREVSAAESVTSSVLQLYMCRLSPVQCLNVQQPSKRQRPLLLPGRMVPDTAFSIMHGLAQGEQ